MSESSLYPTALDDTNLYEVVARLSTTLTADITASTTTIPLTATTGFPTAGYIVIDNETIKYISVSVGSVDATGGRGHAGTAASHTSGAQVLVAVTAAVINKLRAGMIAVQTKVGISASADTTSHDYKLSGVTGSGKAVNNAYAETIAGVKTFSSTPKMDNIAELTGTSGVTIDGVLIKDSLDGSSIIDKTTAQTLTNKTLTSPLFTGTIDGWIAAGTFTYASATTITVASGAASIYQKGDKLKLTQTTVKYFYITTVADTVLTVTGGSDYTVANAAITLPYYSHIENPLGFPHWFAVTAPTFNVAYYDNGAAGQPTTTINRMKISGNQCTVYYKGAGTKASNNVYILFNPSVYPAFITSTVNTLIGTGYVNTTFYQNCICTWVSTTEIDVVTPAAIADDAVIAHFAFILSYEI